MVTATLSKEDIAVLSTASKQGASVQILWALITVGGAAGGLRACMSLQSRIGATYRSLFAWGSVAMWVALLCWYVWTVYRQNTGRAPLVVALEKGVAITRVGVTKAAGGRTESQRVRVTLDGGKDVYLAATSTAQADTLLEVLHRHAPQAVFS